MSEIKDGKKALVLGASGLVGGHLLNQLLADVRYEKVSALVRSMPEMTHPKLGWQLVDFDQMENARSAFCVDHVFVCLGTTIKTAGSQEAFRRVDYHYVLKAAQLAKQAGTNYFGFVSAIGANARSRVFYNRVKGELEVDVARLGLRRWNAVRPSLLLGDRKEFRFGERLGEAVMKALAWAMVGKWRYYRPIHASVVAEHMIRLANEEAVNAPLQVIPN